MPKKSQTRVVEAPSKPSKPIFEGFEGDQGRPFLENHCLLEAADVAVKNSKSATPAHRQNCQNPSTPTEPSGVYHATSAAPDGTACRVTIVELPATGLRYRQTFAHLQLRPPAHIPEDRWRMAVSDGRAFLHRWGEQAEALGWTSADLFGLHTPPAKPHPSYNRLPRYDCTGLCWLLQGRPVVALMAETPAIENPTRSITNFYRRNGPAQHTED